MFFVVGEEVSKAYERNRQQSYEIDLEFTRCVIVNKRPVFVQLLPVV